MTVAQRASANRMIDAKGLPVTLTRRAAGAYDPATGTASIVTSTQLGKGVILPLSPMTKANAGNIVAGDQQMLLSALNEAGGVLTVPHVDDSATMPNGEVLSIIAVEPLNPAGLDILYDCIVRRVG